MELVGYIDSSLQRPILLIFHNVLFLKLYRTAASTLVQKRVRGRPRRGMRSNVDA